MKNREIIFTADGSHSIYVPELNECYHSKFGALAESQHIFINTGFKAIPEYINKINILEIGLGTGLNALLTYDEAAKTGKQIYYTGIEFYPLEIEFIKQLNYTKTTNRNYSGKIFLEIHEASWNKEVRISDFFSIEKINKKIEEYLPEKEKFDLIYFDAFGPEVQPELWTEDIFAKLAASIKLNGILVTYSTKGDVKRVLKKSGFTIEKLPGPPGKREILRAKKLKVIML